MFYEMENFLRIWFFSKVLKKILFVCWNRKGNFIYGEINMKKSINKVKWFSVYGLYFLGLICFIYVL